MQNPDERNLETGMHDPGLTSFDSLQEGSLEPIEPAPPPYKKEPLFNKKVMLAWAIGAAAVWFVFSFVLPIAFESAKSAIVQTIKEAETENGGTVTITRNGRGITITRTNAPAATTPAAGAAPSATATPPVPVQPVQPAQQPQGSAKKAEPSRR